MKKIELEKIRNLIKKDKLREAMETTISIAGNIDNKELYKIAIALSGGLSKWEKDEMHGIGANNEDRGKIRANLLNLVDKLEGEINEIAEKAEKAKEKGNTRKALEYSEKTLMLVEDDSLRQFWSEQNQKIRIDDFVKKAEDAREKGDLREAIEYTEKALLLVEDDSLRQFWLEQNQKIRTTTPSISEDRESYQIRLIFGSTMLLMAIILVYFFTYSHINNESTWDEISKSFKDFELPLVINLILHVSVLTCMVYYLIKPKINIDKWILNADEYFWKKFDNSSTDLQWYSKRANETIKQFGLWWRGLAWAFLLLYIVYFISWFFRQRGVDTGNFENIFDVLANSSEAIFLFVLYRIVTEDTIKPVTSDMDNFKFKRNLSLKNEAFWSLLGLFLFIFLGLITNTFSDSFGAFVLISRTLSGVAVAIGLCLLIGRFDSKFISPKSWQIILLYLYAAIQLLFPLFDPELFHFAVQESLPEIKSKPEDFTTFVFNIKVVVLYFILSLKVYFIYYVIQIHNKDELFYYFLLGSKLNDEIKFAKNSSNSDEE